MLLLEDNGCSDEQLETLRNTVKNQDVKPLSPEEQVTEYSKRDERREKIKRPKKGIKFDLEKNVVKEFKVQDIVTVDQTPLKSAMRNQATTPGRLVKFDIIEEQVEKSEVVQSEEPQNLENCGSESDRHETQSGDIAVDEDMTETPKEESVINTTQSTKLIQVTEEKEQSPEVEEVK